MKPKQLILFTAILFVLNVVILCSSIPKEAKAIEIRTKLRFQKMSKKITYK